MGSLERSLVVKLAALAGLVVVVLAGLPFLARNGYLTQSAALAVVGVLAVGWGGFVVLFPEKHDVLLAGGDRVSETRTQWRRVGERLGGTTAAAFGVYCLYLALL